MSRLCAGRHRFEAQRGQLRTVAYRMLGSVSEADDAVQEAWRGRLLLALTFVISKDKIIEYEVIADPARLKRLDLAVLD